MGIAKTRDINKRSFCFLIGTYAQGNPHGESINAQAGAEATRR
jgi:hypothetical protein